VEEPQRVNLSGRWELDLSRSHFVANAPKELTVRIDDEGDAVHVDMSGAGNDGSELSQKFDIRTDGSSGSAVVNGMRLDVRCHWAGGELLIETNVPAPNGQTTFRDYWSIDAEHDLLIMEHRDDPLAGTRSVFRRSAAGGDPP